MQATAHELKFRPIPEWAGLFVTPGYGRHPDRIIDSWELILVRSGVLHIEDAGIEFRLGPGESLLMQPFRRHRGLSAHPTDLSFFWIHFKLSKQRLASPLALPHHRSVQRSQRLAEWFHHYVADQTDRSLTPIAAESLLLLMLNETAFSPEDERSLAAGSIVPKAEEFISRQMRRGIRPSQVAEAVGYNTAYLSRLFRAVHGVTLGGYIHRMQATQARTLLRDSAAPLKHIAKQCGFRDEGYFRRVFRRDSGVSPREYRNRFGRVHINRD